MSRPHFILFRDKTTNANRCCVGPFYAPREAQQFAAVMERMPIYQGTLAEVYAGPHSVDGVYINKRDKSFIRMVPYRAMLEGKTHTGLVRFKATTMMAGAIYGYHDFFPEAECTGCNRTFSIIHLLRYEGIKNVLTEDGCMAQVPILSNQQQLCDECQEPIPLDLHWRIHELRKGWKASLVLRVELYNPDGTLLMPQYKLYDKESKEYTYTFRPTTAVGVRATRNDVTKALIKDGVEIHATWQPMKLTRTRDVLGRLYNGIAPADAFRHVPTNESHRKGM